MPKPVVLSTSISAYTFPSCPTISDPRLSKPFPLRSGPRSFTGVFAPIVGLFLLSSLNGLSPALAPYARPVIIVLRFAQPYFVVRLVDQIRPVAARLSRLVLAGGILSAAVVKPIVYGAATGIAVSSYSSLGAGYDGFKPAYFRGLAEALAANIALQAGWFFAARLEGTKGAVVGLVWGSIVAAALVVRLRYLLHFAVLEAALEAAATGGQPKDTARGTAYCP